MIILPLIKAGLYPYILRWTQCIFQSVGGAIPPKIVFRLIVEARHAVPLQIAIFVLRGQSVNSGD